MKIVYLVLRLLFFYLLFRFIFRSFWILLKLIAAQSQRGNSQNIHEKKYHQDTDIFKKKTIIDAEFEEME